MGRRHDYALESAARTVRLPACCSRMQCAPVRFTHMVKTLLAIHNYEQHDEDLLESHYAGTLAEGKTQLEAFDEVHLPALDVDHIFVNPHFVPRCMKGWSDGAIESVVHTRKELKKLIDRRKQVSVKRFQV